MNHLEITERTAKWLKKHKENVIIPNCPIVVFETKTATVIGEIPDVIGWCSWASVLIEVKISRSDFLRDKKKIFRVNESLGVGNFRYYICPEHLIKIDDLPENWGLLYILKNGEINIQLPAKNQLANTNSERTMLLSIIRRIKPNPNETTI